MYMYVHVNVQNQEMESQLHVAIAYGVKLLVFRLEIEKINHKGLFHLLCRNAYYLTLVCLAFVVLFTN